MNRRGALQRARIAVIAACVVGFILARSPAGAQIFGSSQTPQPARYAVARMGLAMPEADARHGIAFRPFAPPRRIVAAALLPPFHGDDLRANRGIGFEYDDGSDHLYALAQWPANGGSITQFAPLDPPQPACTSARSFSRGARPGGIVWSTPHGLIMTLQPDGKSDGRMLQREWKKLIRRGVCS